MRGREDYSGVNTEPNVNLSGTNRKLTKLDMVEMIQVKKTAQCDIHALELQYIAFR